MNDKINDLLARFNLRLLKKNNFDKLTSERDFFSHFAELHTNEDYTPEKDLEIVIFSMDRAMQLFTLISSVHEYINNHVKIHVLYRSRTPEHKKSYEQVIDLFQKNKSITFTQQIDKSDFRSKLISILENIKTQSMFFLVDDIVFKDFINLEDLLQFNPLDTLVSLRLGTHLNRIYTMNSAQSLPKFINYSENSDKVKWIWKQGEFDWAYPLSVDGNIFNTKEVLLITKYIEFNTPNSYEANLQVLNKFFNGRYGVCYKDSKIVNLPINRVNTDTTNQFGNVDENFLLDKWNQGYIMDYKKFFKVKNISAHQELDVSFIKRK